MMRHRFGGYGIVLNAIWYLGGHRGQSLRRRNQALAAICGLGTIFENDNMLAAKFGAFILYVIACGAAAFLRRIRQRRLA